MPTIGVYVPMQVARAVGRRHAVDINNADFQELVRNLVANTLDQEGGISHSPLPFQYNCLWAHLHRDGIRCRHCGGS